MTAHVRFAVVAALSAVLLVSGCQNGAMHTASDNPITGTWRLVTLEEPGPDGTVHPVPATGMLTATTDGHLTIQVMYDNLQSSQSGPVQYAQGGYEASFGTYEVDPKATTFTYHVQGALVRTLVGQTQTRVFQLAERSMTVHSPNPSESWRVHWQRDG